MWTMKTGLSVGEVKTLGSTSEYQTIPCAFKANANKGLNLNLDTVMG